MLTDPPIAARIDVGTPNAQGWTTVAGRAGAVAPDSIVAVACLDTATVEQSARLFRKIEYLSVIGNIAPMMGLLGTVIGMIFAFRELSDSQGAPRAADLAEGIYLALITTVEGLIVAIPSLAAFAVFRNRVDHLVAEVTYVAQHVTAPLKRGRPKASVDFQAPPPPPPIGGKR